ncbi:MAG: poly-beta-1,6-N-acetyl-D-glucosamine N-deacetylase PgaB [Haemophilus parainfluenzae]|uniref:poly-beta-1,6-N-acetyl-D-glucosamine N-deacetylase PgaB n=1 Tax=uncultured Haemophilus sp. TaxID=237779 RepID=UPI0025F33145|nr:poly-beta-1,6-N-acetyl-D-glucosamine N-deacetylase PgaB [uncultured Haemophilus sp.]MBD9096504.1 poly-beta-1,6-N-acetyl-D-glucosamine N-deacetylase PgaB [Haemophilus parainfluenzae]
MRSLKHFAKIIICMLSLFSAFAFAQDRYGVLAYHSVVDESAAENQKQYFPQTISAQMLIKHFNWLKENGYNVISWQQVIDAENGQGTLPDNAVLLSFDDGYETMYNVVFPLLKAYNYPAVFAPVTGWLDTPADQKIAYADKMLDRSVFATWSQVKEMEQSGLVEVASHTHNLHNGINANPSGGQLPAVIAPEYKNGKYETEDAYKNRLKSDFTRSVQTLVNHVGKKPRVMVWPYGQFNDVAVQLARQAGMPHYFSLGEKIINKVGDKHIGRLLLNAETDLNTVKNYLDGIDESKQIQRVLHVDLDYVYDADKAQQAKNLDKLIDRIYRYGVTTVYLQAFSDPDGDGVADALYFPNKYLPVRDDIFGRIAWQLQTRAGVKVYAWMPVLAFDLRKSVKEAEYVIDSRTGKPSTKAYLRLSPYNNQNVEIIKSIYNDLSFYAKFNGILFHDDAFLTDFEGAEGNHAEGMVSPQAKQKTQDLILLTHQLTDALKPYFLRGSYSLKTARNLYASVITTPNAEEWLAQNLKTLTENYDTTAIMAMPYMENEQPISQKEAYQWFSSLIENVKAQAPLEKVLFEFQAVNWRTQKPIPESELIDWMTLLQKNHIYSYGYYPDNFLTNQPDMNKMKPYFSVNTNAGKQ